MSKSVTYEQFYEAVGLANSAWVSVEEGLRDVFTRLVVCAVTGRSLIDMRPDAMWIMGNIFYSSTNLRGRLSMIEQVYDRAMDDVEIKAEWNAIKNGVLKLYKRRNILAHGTVWGNEHVGPSSIGPSMFSGIPGAGMNYVQVREAAASFFRMAERLTELAILTNRYLVTGSKDDT